MSATGSNKNTSNLIRLRRVEVEGLFGIYDHMIDLNLEDRVTVLHGPNGVGKTHTLGMINALLSKNTAYFKQVPCKLFRLTFADSVVELTPDLAASESRPQRARLTVKQDEERRSEMISLGTRTEEWEHLLQLLQRRRPTEAAGLAPGSEEREEQVPEPDMQSTFGAGLPDGDNGPGAPSWFDAFLDKANTYFIEAQRLVRTRKDPRERPMPGPYASALFNPPSNPDISASLTVLERSREFRNRLRETLANYGRRAQVLDQTFPQRLVKATGRLGNAELNERMKGLEKDTEQLKELGIFDEATEHPTRPFDARLPELNDTQARVMTLYVQDTERKLGEIAALASRVRSLLDGVNGKYRHKRLRADRGEGLVAETDSGEKLPLSSLSSGEQHELVLHYDLLFRVPENTIVLIDEPELSFHVSWQKRFLPELLDIAQLSRFDAIVATHSPYIIGERDDLMVGLGDAA